jgi:hypothetical protein
LTVIKRNAGLTFDIREEFNLDMALLEDIETLILAIINEKTPVRGNLARVSE